MLCRSTKYHVRSSSRTTCYEVHNMMITKNMIATLLATKQTNADDVVAERLLPYDGILITTLSSSSSYIVRRTPALVVYHAAPLLGPRWTVDSPPPPNLYTRRFAKERECCCESCWPQQASSKSCVRRTYTAVVAVLCA